ncbi:MAG: cell division protein FtsQ/DivIB [Polaromonas sp.]|nr:cell division protein FtsQ/DivIB [Polaromonas sp.]
MNAASTIFVTVFSLMVIALLVSWLMRQSLFDITAIEVQGDLQHNSPANLRANVSPRLAGNFFMMDLTRTRAAFEAIPWVRKAVVQREFPNRLKVSLQEHQPVAFWGTAGEARLINSFGEVFEVNQGDVESEDLPVLSGPLAQAGLILATYRSLLPLFVQFDAVLEQLELTSQANWRARLDSGAVIDLGNGSTEEVIARTARFIATLGQVSSRYGRELESADLRYSSGYAIKLRGVTTGATTKKEAKKATR